jgi:dual specificity protein kinase YAK1
LIDFLRQVLVFEPDKRLTPDKALKHAFIQTDYAKLDEEARVGRKRSFHNTQGTLKPLKSILKKRNPNGFQSR